MRKTKLQRKLSVTLVWITGLLLIASCAGNYGNANQTINQTSSAGAPEGAIIQLRVLGTSDIHSNIMNYDYYQDKTDNAIGLVKTATLIRQARAEARNTILVDNGDMIQGNPLSEFLAKKYIFTDHTLHPVQEILKLLDYDVTTLGNHEFSFGLDYLNNYRSHSAIPQVCANVYVDDGDDDPTNDRHFTQPFLIMTKTVADTAGNEQNLKVGFIGFVPPQIMRWDKEKLIGKIKTADIMETAKKMIPQMKAEGADLVIVLAHSAINAQSLIGMDEDVTYYLAQLPDVDAIVTGHDHLVFPGEDYAGLEGVDIAAGTIFGVPVVMPGFWGNHLGVIDLTLRFQNNHWDVVQSHSQARPVFKRDNKQIISLVESDPEVAAVIQPVHDQILKWMQEPIGTTITPIFSFFSLVQDDPSIQIVNNAQTWFIKKQLADSEYGNLPVLSAAAPFRAGRQGGNDFTYIPAGTLTLRSTTDLYVYPNTVYAVLLTGAEVVDWLERSAGIFYQLNPDIIQPQELINMEFRQYNFDVIDGLTYQIDVTQPSRYDIEGKLINPGAQRIVNVKYNNQPLDKNQKFIVVTNNYRATGGGNFPNLAEEKIILKSSDETRQVLTSYVSELGTVDPSVDMNWSFKPVNDKVRVIFPTSNTDLARELSSQFPKLAVTDNQTKEGFTMYQIDLAP